MAYIYKCPTDGQCRRKTFERNGIPWKPEYQRTGNKHFYTESPHGIPLEYSYKCCTQCHLPINLAEAIRINKLLGHKLEDEKLDDDFMELLNAVE